MVTKLKFVFFIAGSLRLFAVENSFADCSKISIVKQQFFDNCDREAHFRGFNVSGSVKLKETGFLPFKNTKDATLSLLLSFT